MVEAVIPERFLRVFGRLLPFKALHKQMENARMMRSKAREIFEQKKRALELGDEAVKQQVGEGKDIMSVLCAYFD